ncbi:glycoside hydrolase family 26 protein [Ligilactobacillus sp.]|uniref:glycoside hydrolase family 26 protein n=1 Tax=Ligilactobacillus sp. TaxID=2767921 RepID=UPI002FDFAB75
MNEKAEKDVKKQVVVAGLTTITLVAGAYAAPNVSADEVSEGVKTESVVKAAGQADSVSQKTEEQADTQKAEAKTDASSQETLTGSDDKTAGASEDKAGTTLTAQDNQNDAQQETQTDQPDENAVAAHADETSRTMPVSQNMAVHAAAAQAQQSPATISDPNATDQARKLLGYLDSYKKSDDIMFGQQHATDAAQSLTDDQKQPGRTDSDVKGLTNNNPAVVGWDAYLSLSGDEAPGVKGDSAQSIRNLSTSMNAVHDSGSIIVLSMHPDNFVTGGNYGDTKGDCVRNILPGGSANAKFNAWLDKLVELSSQLKDKNGEQYSIIFRPFHEQTGAWFWWGNGTTTPAQYKAVYRYLVNYLRDHGVHNFLYAFTPGGDLSGNVDRYLETYPGDDYVDILGIDNYDTGSVIGSDAWMNGLKKDVAMIARLADEKGKVSALTEYGRHLYDNADNQGKDWYTKVLNTLEGDQDAKKISYMFTWANFGFPDNIYVPFKGFKDDEVTKDFLKFANDSRVVMSERNKQKFNDYAAVSQGAEVKKNNLTMTTMSPTNSDTITSEKSPVNVRLDNGTASKVVLEIAGRQFVLESTDGKNFSGTMQLPESADKSVQKATVTAYDANGNVVGTEELQLFVKFSAKAENVGKVETSDLKSNGTWAESSSPSATGRNTSQGFEVDLDSAFDKKDTWQEVKFATVNVDKSLLSKTNQLHVTGLVSATAGHLQAYAFTNTGDKTDYKSTDVDVSGLEMVEYNGRTYRKFDFTITFPEYVNTDDIQFGFVGVNAENFDSVIVQSVELQNLAKETDKTPHVVDDFSSYLGSDVLLNRAYATNGDSTTVKLVKQSDGTYRMNYTYTIGANGYAGRGQTFATPKDWSGTKGVTFYLGNASYPGDDLDVQINMNGVTFEAHIDLKDAHNGVVFVPFSAFAPASWDTANAGKTVNDEFLKNVNTFYLYINSQVEGTRSIEVGDIKAVTEEPDNQDKDNQQDSDKKDDQNKGDQSDSDKKDDQNKGDHQETTGNGNQDDSDEKGNGQDKGAQNVGGTNGTNGSATGDKKVTPTAVSKNGTVKTEVSSKSADSKDYPQTGEKNEQLGILGILALIGASILGFFGIGKGKKKA